jgi:DNA-binding CsgD family transcriptional regulator
MKLEFICATNVAAATFRWRVRVVIGHLCGCGREPMEGSMAVSATTAADLVGRVYQRPGRDEQWQCFLSAAAEALQMNTIQLLGYDFSTVAGRTIQTWGIEPYWIEQHDRYYGRITPALSKQGVLPGKHCELNYTHVEGIAETWYRSEYYHDFLRPQDCHYGCGTILSMAGSEVQLLGGTWRRKNGPPNRGQQRLLSLLTPHMANRLRFENLLAATEQENRSLERALELLGAACAVLDARGRAVWCNGPAERLLAGGDGLRLGRGGRLLARRPACAAALRRSLSGALGIVSAEQLEVPAAVAVERPSGKRPYHLFVWPLVPRGGCGPAAAQALVLINDPEERPPAVAALLGRLYGLTPAEARVAAGLVAGASPKEIAEQHAVSLHTVRSQIRQLLDKAGCRRQTQLIATLYRSLGRLVR